MNKPKLSVEDFYSQFHGLEHHNDPGNYTKPLHHVINPALPKKHKGLDLRELRNRKKHSHKHKNHMVDRAMQLVAHLSPSKSGNR